MNLTLKRTLATHQKYFRRFVTTNTVDDYEIKKFQEFQSEWWNEFGPMKALHSMNKLRIPLVRDGLINSGKIDRQKINNCLPLTDISILDVGCGGGILSEPLARLGCSVTGIDANCDLLQVAKKHAEARNLDIQYVEGSIENHAIKNQEKYDAVIASEILEHISKKAEFIEACVTCLKESGCIFITTINKTSLAKFAGITLAENMFNVLPRGTHEYKKFIEPIKLQRLVEDNNCRTELLHGMFYNMFTNTWHWCSNTSINYSLHASKLKNSE